MCSRHFVPFHSTPDSVKKCLIPKSADTTFRTHIQLVLPLNFFFLLMFCLCDLCILKVYTNRGMRGNEWPHHIYLFFGSKRQSCIHIIAFLMCHVWVVYVQLAICLTWGNLFVIVFLSKSRCVYKLSHNPQLSRASKVVPIVSPVSPSCCSN